MFTSLPELEWTDAGGLAWNLASGDLDLDGDEDLFVVMDDTAHVVLLNDGDGVFSELQGAVQPEELEQGADAFLVDVNSDEYLDAVVANGWGPDGPSMTNKLYLNDGNGYFSQQPDSFYSSRYNFWSVELIVSAHDTFVVRDLIFSGTEHTPDLYRIMGNSEFDYLGSDVISTKGILVVGDFEGNGYTDLVQQSESHLLMYQYSGDGSFELVLDQYASYALGHYSFVLRDVDGDGLQDLILPGIALFYRDLVALYGP
jgi:hypothetical protein